MLAAKRMGLTVLLTVALTELLAQLCHFVFEFHDAAIAFLAAGAKHTGRGHEELLKHRLQRLVKRLA